MSTSATPLAESSNDCTTAQIAAIYKASGDTMRLQMLRIMRRDSFGVLELSHLFDISQPATSHHLKVLTQAGLITMRREGTSIFYRRPYESNDLGLRRSIFDAIDKLPISPTLRLRLDTIYQNRSKRSQLFFQQNIDRFKEQQDLIASYVDYGESIINFIKELPFTKGSCLEVGVGQGEFLIGLAKVFRKILAIDNNSQVLKIARTFAESNKITKVRFKLGEASDLLNKKLKVDCITCNMVLHHNPLPAKMIEDFAQLMKPHGNLFITDLCQHDQDWARTSCGDQWLGFKPEDISQWCIQAGLLEGENQFLSLRNGFQVQIRQFYKPSPVSYVTNH